MEVSQNQGSLFGVPQIWVIVRVMVFGGSILAEPNLGKLPSTVMEMLGAARVAVQGLGIVWAQVTCQ